MARREYNPLELLFRVEAEMQRHVDGGMPSVLFQPRVDMYETDSGLIVKLEAAGIQPERVHVTLSADDSTITIAGERIEPQSEHTGRLRSYHLEIFYGAFEREVRLPSCISIDREQVTARFRDGFLMITLPKRTSGMPEKRTIQISS